MRIVLIEDSPGDARWLQLMAAETGIMNEIIVFGSAVDALAHFESNDPPALILTNWYQPLLSFPEFIDILRTFQNYEIVPVVILTGNVEVLERGPAEVGAFSCLAKPVTAERLKELFHRVRIG